ncbi:tumor necrosis factor receptor superfamily member 25 [Pelodytes ibericus]
MSLDGFQQLNFTVDEIKEGNSQTSYRFKRSIGKQCNESLRYDYIAKRCCKKCPKGEYVKEPCKADGLDPKCDSCESGTFLQHPNYLPHCRACSHCDPETETLEQECSASTNTKCICKEGRYRDSGICPMCTKCRNRNVIKNCSKEADTVCGKCLPGFHESDHECAPCHHSAQQLKQIASSSGQVLGPEIPPPSCVTSTQLKLHPLHSKHLKQPSSREKEADSTAANGPLILVNVALIAFSLASPCLLLNGPEDEDRVSNSNDNGAQSHFLLKFEDPTSEMLLSSNRSPGQLTSALQNGRALYDIIDCVPVRRWKEFMRTLELPDKEIEIVEMEISSFRDQQYEMLRRWCHLRTATLEAIYNALERMNLSGCVDELRHKLED